MLDVTLYANADDRVEFDNIDYVSFVNAGTYGPPPIIAPGHDHVNDDDITVLYVNTGAIMAVEVHKIS